MKPNRIYFIAFLFAITFLTSHVSVSQKIAQLKGLYATSTAIPQDEYDVSNIFDGDQNTYWSTMPGAGPGEGIMIYFTEPQPVNYIKISQVKSDNYAPFDKITYYKNGSNPKTLNVKSNEQTFIYAHNTRSLFIKFENSSNSNIEYHNGIEIRKFQNLSYAISEIEFFSKKDEKLKVKVPITLKANVEASSTLDPKLSYGIQNLFDGRKDFGWVEGAKGNGINESITISLNQPQPITGVKISNGFQRSPKHFTANTRAKEIEVIPDNGNGQSFFLKDENSEQQIQFDAPIEGKNLKFVFKEVYPGTKYQDLVISELKLMNGEAEISINPQMTDQIKTEALEKIKGTVLENVVDKQVYNAMEGMDGYRRSIILRSDYTFVSYGDEWADGSSSNEIVAEGNWQIKEIGSSRARIRIFGKLTQISKIIDFYSGNSESSYLQIFQDYLNITYNKISGEKFLEDFIISAE
ncbi:MAG: discoidin domain-containing protein [Cyclobacteriaceae bacterium]